MLSRDEFEVLVRAGIEALPAHIRQAMDNVEIVIEDEAVGDRAKLHGARAGELLLGLYEGVPKVQRGSTYGGVLPDKITIFQHSIETVAGNDSEKLRQLVQDTVYHEIGHHFGFDEKEIRAIEAKRRKCAPRSGPAS